MRPKINKLLPRGKLILASDFGQAIMNTGLFKLSDWAMSRRRGGQLAMNALTKALGLSMD
jgi:hypothetical protein